jgi:hypothetical protein
VRFNGSGPNEDLGHETFYVARVFRDGYRQERRPGSGLFFQCCKTARKPYDLAVVACLTALKVRVPEVELSSDGSFEERAHGIALAESVYALNPAPVIALKLRGQLWNCDNEEMEVV